MKKVMSLLLALSLCIGLCACKGTGNETHDYILHLLENKEYDMAIHVIEGLRAGDSAVPQQPSADQQQEDPGTPQTYDQVVELVPETDGAHWLFHMDVINEADHTLTLEALLIIDRLDGQERGTAGFEGEDLNRLPLGKLVLEPNMGVGWDDAHPVDPNFNQREYLHVFRNEQGEMVRFSYVFDMQGMEAEGSVDFSNQSEVHWFFPIMLENTGSTPWELYALDITNFMDGQQLGAVIIEGEDLANAGLGGLILEPGQQHRWDDAHPAVTDWNSREYRFHFKDGNGQKQILSFRFEDLDEQYKVADYSQDQGKDLKTLRHDASFEVEVSNGVYWVPAVTLGSSRYSNAEIHNMFSASPEEKRDRISTLYEALQLYQVGNFTSSDDNVRIMENGVNWEHHKPGYHAVRTNTGCCATDSNWLNYILDGDYAEVGYIATSQRDGSGHVYNYILQDGWYYFVDLTHYHAGGSPMDTAVENGDFNGYRVTDFILGNIHKVRNVQDYVDYVQRAFGDPPGLMFMYTAENVMAVDGARSQSGVDIIYEDANGQKINVIFDDPADSLGFIRAESPRNIPDWSNLP